MVVIAGCLIVRNNKNKFFTMNVGALEKYLKLNNL